MAAKGGVGVVAVVMVPVLVVALSLFVLFFGAGSASACTVGTGSQISVDGIAADAKVGAFNRGQLVNAALIANAAVTAGLPAAAQTIGVQTAIGESSLVNITYGDGATNPDGSIADSIGLFQQQSSWGTVAQRMDPTTSAGLFFTRLPGVAGWEAMDPSLAINKVQGNADPNHYTKYRADAVAIMTYLTGAAGGAAGGGGCSVSGDARALAAGLVTAMGEGRLVLAEDRYAAEIRGVADGTASSICGIDVRILQVVTIALNTFPKVGVSDLNRQCTGSIEGAGTESAHWINGGGHAVDFYSLDGQGLTGCDANSMKLLSVLDPLVPAGSRAGQSQCRTATYSHIVQFQDTLSHLHFDVGFTDGPVINP
ncbi:hypothetical protein [Subtercola boreus]|uniref:Peptidase M23 n=1 Tax=Subtercola boreus TaxID=120213 RepID=A0A3E0W8H9_9MICO|nr:hypothetical protein [Subtercola boreus]RFA17745.1 hypothetical protein B7R24_16500 [Subtercola boreus]RFA17774.1 hypothetical protein B7R23_16670 [Subtercola boreus]RFA24507.1 hypothetical protein B7R25_16665 [Subtercola boreus]